MFDDVMRPVLASQYAGKDLMAPTLVDPHHHLWDLEHNPYPWLQTRPLAPAAGR